VAARQVRRLEEHGRPPCAAPPVSKPRRVGKATWHWARSTDVYLRGRWLILLSDTDVTVSDAGGSLPDGAPSKFVARVFDVRTRKLARTIEWEVEE
jgi:hypothetical protein